MGKLRDRMAVDLRLRGLSPVTQRRYLGCAERFVAHHRRSPTTLGEDEIRAFLDHLVRYNATPTQFEWTKDADEILAKIERARRVMTRRVGK